MTACAVCPRTAPDGERLCLVHAAELHAWLAEIPRQALLLADEFLVPARSGHRPGGAGRADAPVPVDLRVLALLGPGRYDSTGPDDDGQAPIAATLGAWAGHIAYTHPAAHRDPHGTAYTVPCEQAWPARGETITGWCAWLTAYLPYALGLPLAAELHRALGDLVHHLRCLTHSTPAQHHRAAPCPACDVFALVRTDGRWHIHCLACGHQLDPDAYDEHAARYLAARQSEQTGTTHPREDRPMTTDRIRVHVLLTVGTEAEIVATDVPPAERADPERYPVAEISHATGIPAARLAGARLTAVVGDDARLTGWQRA
ncbi:hypothetical protein OG866_27005 [Streptomyces sp. NBC_00663]|uniref:hypothetical protein n=1 Tax=Streptomyces sp. NBC_00663 TaxID=2975801 RepID=UPI002E335E09|nr:hypothetical protein [Streptomyces sp. NBC_00663]